MSGVETKSSALRLLMSERTLVIAHRGFSRLAPENTLPAFELAVAAGVDAVECDVRCTHDGQLVVIHDHQLDRTTDAVRCWRRRRNRVDARSLSDIRGLDAGRWFKSTFAGTCVPILSETLSLVCRGSVALIERKAGSIAAYLDVLREMNHVKDVIVQSFDWNFLRALHGAEPRLVLGALGPPRLLAGGRRPFAIARKLNAGWLSQIQKTGARIAVWNRKVTKHAVQLAHQRGLKVWIYTVDDWRLGQRLLHAGVDGLITNNPTGIQRALQLG